MEEPILGDFILRRKIGEGGFGTVYIAEQRTLARPAVVKVMRRSLGRDAIERFVLEARLASRLDHPSAAHVYAFGAEPDGTLWIAMELVRGTPLDVLLDQGPLPLDRFLPMFERLAEAVQAAHAQGIVHRDIKPANVMVTAIRGRLVPKLLDFGIAKQLVRNRDSAPVVMATITSTARPLVAGESVQDDATLAASASDATSATDQTVSAQHTATAPPTSTATNSLTHAGQILGSPPYMAPEQWRDASLVGPWTDQYALALLAYEALAGARAFEAKTTSDYAEQHLQAKLPRSPGIPEAIHAVLARATAKATGERYPDLDAFIAAMRTAAGWVPDDEPVPALRAELVAAWSADAPQPIAETIAALAAARTLARVGERASSLARVLARWLGVLALACRSRLGRVEDSAVAETIRALRRRPLRDEEWLELVVGLASDHAARPEAWPVPELATWSADREAIANLRGLVQGELAIAEDEHLAARVARQIAACEAALDALAWLLDYEVARGVDGGWQLWSGLRSDDRVIRRADAELDRVVLLDADGACVVALSPLFAIAPPLAGEAAEMFVFLGPARASDVALFAAWPRGYEREDGELWSWFAAHLLEPGASTQPGIAHERPPYPGLAAFGTDDRGSFVGREREVAELVNRLRVQSIIVVVGPSGAGKSSFLAAGVIPALPASWRALVVRPGRDPIGALAAAATQLQGSPYRDAPMSRDAVGVQIVAAAEGSDGSILVIVDQSEELFTQNGDVEQRDAFARLLLALAASPRVRVVLGVRDDFLVRLDEIPVWRGMIARHVQVLGVPGRRELERIVTEPARRRGYDLEDPALASKMVDEVAARPGALPLLSFAAAELWERRDRHFKRITKQSYEAIGGVAGALVQHADGVVDRMTSADRRLVRLAFRRLLTPDGARIVETRAELVAALGEPAGTRIVERLLAARLVVSRDDDGEQQQIEIIHEALVTTWPRLAAWRDEDVSGAKLQHQLAAAARHWEERGRPDGLLWRDAALDELARWDGRLEAGLAPVERAFADASTTSARRSRRRRVVIAGTAFAVLATATIALAIMNRRVTAQRAEAEARVAAGFEEHGRLAVQKGELGRALLYLTEATRLGVTGPAHDLLVERAAAAVEALEAVELHEATPFDEVRWGGAMAITRDAEAARVRDPATWQVRTTIPRAMAAVVGNAIASLDLETGAVALHDASGKDRWRVPTVYDSSIIVVGVVGNERAETIATYGGSRVHLWKLDGTSRGVLEHAGTVREVTFDADGARLAVAADSEIHVWDVATARRIATCSTPAKRLWQLQFAPRGEAIVASADDGALRVCDAATGTLRHTLAGHLNQSGALAISGDGTLLASVSLDGTARLWELSTGAPRGVLVGHRGPVRAIALAPDGRTVATGGDDGTIRLWDTDSATLLASLDGHAGRILSLTWRDGKRLASAAFDGTIRRWNVARAIDHSIARLHGAPVRQLDLSRAGTHLLSRGDDGTVVVWDSASHTPRAPWPGETVAAAAFVDQRVLGAMSSGIFIEGTPWQRPGERVVFLRASADGRTIATSSEDGTIRTWTVGGKEIGVAKVGFAARDLVFDASGRWLIAQSPAAIRAGLVAIDARTGHEVARLGSDQAVHGIAIDATRVAVAADRAALIFDLGTWKEQRLERSTVVRSVALAPDGRVVTATNDAMVTVSSRDGRALSSLAGSGRSTALDISTDGTLLAVGTTDGAIDVWDLASYRLLVSLSGHRMATYAVELGDDGTRLFSAGQDGRVALWSLARPGRSAAELERLVRCRVPLQLQGETIVPRALPFDDPSCG